MPKPRSHNKTKSKQAIQQPTPPAQEGEETDEQSHVLHDDPNDKDATELELEKALFGDDLGFQQALQEHTKGRYDSEVDDDDLLSKQALNRAESEAEGGIEDVDDADLFFLDNGPSETANDAPLSTATYSEENDSEQGENAPVWEDSDDERIMVSLAANPRLRKLRRTEAEDVVNGKEYIKRLRRQFERLYPVPEWANPSSAAKVMKKKRRRPSGAAGSSAEESTSADDMNIDDNELSAQPLADILRSTDDLTRGSAGKNGGQGKLRPEILNIQKTRDVGTTQPSAINSLAFHPTLPLVLSSGPASTVYLHQIDPSNSTPNPLLTSLHIRSTPLSTTAFSAKTGSRIFFSGRRRFFHVWDLESGQIEKVSHMYGHQDEQKSMERFKLSPCGRWMGLEGSGRKGGGSVNIINATTLQWIAQVRIDSRGGVADFEWWGDGDGLCIAGKSGEIGEWSMIEKRMLGRWNDEGAVGTTIIALGGKSGREDLGGDRWIAVGSSSGVVNIYDRRGWLGEDGILANPKPTRTFGQLVTATSNLTFSKDGQLLAMSSRWKRDALRLIHLPSCTVYRNWPTSATPLGRITAVAFSKDSDMLAVANEQGKIRLWEIRS